MNKVCFFGFVVAAGVLGVFLSYPRVVFGAADACQGVDVNGDGVVNIVDLVTVSRKFGQQVSGGSEDVNGDGRVNIIDLVTVAREFGETCVAQSPQLSVSLDSTFFGGGPMFIDENGSTASTPYVMGRFLLSASGGDVVVSRIVPAIDPFPSAEFSVQVYDGSFSFPNKSASFTGDGPSFLWVPSWNDWAIFRERFFTVPDGATVPIILSFSARGDISDISHLRVGIQSISFQGTSPEVVTGLPLFGSSREVLSLERNLSAPSSEKVRPRIKFFLDPRVAGDVSLRELGDRLSAYVHDLNSVFLKSTRIEYVFDPLSDVILTDYLPGGGGCMYLDRGYEIGALVRYETSNFSSGFIASGGGGAGLCRFFPTNNMNFISLSWARVYGREDILGSLDMREDYYSNQLYVLVHEIGHKYGLGLGEYYKLPTIKDRTGVPPILDVSIRNENDSYWRSRRNVLFDPMATSRYDSGRDLETAEFSPFSSRMINTWALEGGGIDGDSPKEASIVVEVLDSNRRGISECKVRVFAVQVGSPYTSEMVNSGQTNASGRFEFLWSTLNWQSLHNTTNMTRLVKVACDGYAPQGQWLSVFDVQAARYMPGGGVLGDFHYPGKLEFIMERASQGVSNVFDLGRFFSNLFDAVRDVLDR